MELRVGNKYRLGRKIGSGSFGDIYLELVPAYPRLTHQETEAAQCSWLPRWLSEGSKDDLYALGPPLQ